MPRNAAFGVAHRLALTLLLVSGATAGPHDDAPLADLFAPLEASAERAAHLQAELGAVAEPLETDHFLLVSTAGPRAARELAGRLEAVYRENVRFARELALPARRPPAKLTVLLLRDFTEYRAFAQAAGASNEEVLGFFDVVRNRCVFFDLATYPPVARLREEVACAAASEPGQRRRLEDQLGRNTQALLANVVQHEAAHQVQADLGLVPDDAPTWLIEGLAQMFELPLVERGATLPLSVNRYRLTEFSRLHADETAWGPELRRIIGDNGRWRGGADYSLSWALTDYLYKRQRARLAEYLRDLGARPDAAPRGSRAPQDGFERVFGPVDDQFVRRFGQYVQRLQARHGVPPSAPTSSPP